MEEFFYIAAFSENDQGGVYTCRYEKNEQVHVTSFVPLKKAGYLALDRQKKMLLATCAFDGKEDGVARFSAHADGTLVLLDVAPSGGSSCCHVGFSPDEKFAYAANYRSGSFAEFSLAGQKIRRTRLTVHEGHGVHPVRQESAHIHFCHATPDGKYIAVVDLGLDRIDCYSFMPGEGICDALAHSSVIEPAGSGPRHLVFDGISRAYLVNELGNTVMTLHYCDGVFSPLATLPTLPFETDCAISKAGAIRLAGNGTLAVSNRGIDTLIFFSPDENGDPVRKQFCYSGGKSPRDISFLPGGRFAAANEFSDKVSFFRTTPRGYEPDGNELTLPRPLCILPR